MCGFRLGGGEGGGKGPPGVKDTPGHQQYLLWPQGGSKTHFGVTSAEPASGNQGHGKVTGQT